MSSNKNNQHVLEITLFVITLATGCSRAASVENDSETNADSASELTDTNYIVPIESACDNLTDQECKDSDDSCTLMWVKGVHTVDGADGLFAACGVDQNYGCTSVENCYENIEMALDENGDCWWMLNGALPNEPGWEPAIDDEYCKSPVRVHSCIE